MFIERILSGAREMGIPMTDEQARKFELYHELLVQANAQFNLTRVPDDIGEAIDRNYLDCISPVARGFSPQTAIDVGSGAGFPGIPLAIMLPETRFTLLDALDKRVKFLDSVVRELNLNAECIHARCEDAARTPALREQFDCAVARAVAPMNVLCEYLLPFVRVGGTVVALKGPQLESELAGAQKALKTLGGRVEGAFAAPIPHRDWNHKIAVLKKIVPTPPAYPRKAGTPERKPL